MTYSRRRSVLLAAPVVAALLLACTASEAEPEIVDALPVNEPLPTAVAPVEVEPRVYIVQERDSLISIAEAEDVTLAEILELNDVPNPSVIEPGLELLLPPDPAAVEAAAAAAAAAAARVPTAAPTAVDEAWYQRWADGIPALPDQLDPARPVLLALAAVGATILAVGAIAVGVPLVYGLLSGGASGIAFGSGRLQAAIAGMPHRADDRSDRDPSDRNRQSGRRWYRPAIGWPGRLRISRSTLSLSRPRVGTPGRIPAPVTAPSPRVSRDRPGFGLRLGSGVARRLRSVGASTSELVRRTGALLAELVRRGGRQLQLLVLAVAAASARLGRATGRFLARTARHAWAMPADYLHDRNERRRRRQFREQIEADTAARMRLGLRGDTEAYLQKSVDESLREGWRLEAAWCLQLMAEEADRRANHALAELRRVRARELIREHALLEEPAPAEQSLT